MIRYNIKTMTVAIGLWLCGGAMASGMTKAEYEAAEDSIALSHKKDMAACDALAGNAKDVCAAEAKGWEKVAKAELEADYKPGAKAVHDVQIARAEAAYKVAMEKCDDAAGNAKDVCVKEAKAAETQAKADAKAQLKASDAQATAHEKSATANTEARKQVAEARREAAADKSDAAYSLAKEKCDALAGDAKDTCLDQAKTVHGRK
ncbi:MAG: hypothetical protein QM739_06295 [Propionivibrio sp.]